MSNDPYPNNADVISCEAIKSAPAAGRLKNKLSSKDLFWINSILFLLLVLICLVKFGSITTPIAIPAIAKLIW